MRWCMLVSNAEQRRSVIGWGSRTHWSSATGLLLGGGVVRFGAGGGCTAQWGVGGANIFRACMATVADSGAGCHRRSARVSMLQEDALHAHRGRGGGTAERHENRRRFGRPAGTHLEAEPRQIVLWGCITGCRWDAELSQSRKRCSLAPWPSKIQNCCGRAELCHG